MLLRLSYEGISQWADMKLLSPYALQIPLLCLSLAFCQQSNELINHVFYLSGSAMAK